LASRLASLALLRDAQLRREASPSRWRRSNRRRTASELTEAARHSFHRMTRLRLTRSSTRLGNVATRKGQNLLVKTAPGYSIVFQCVPVIRSINDVVGLIYAKEVGAPGRSRCQERPILSRIELRASCAGERLYDHHRGAGRGRPRRSYEGPANGLWRCASQGLIWRGRGDG
jgi:hypothetical protein